MLEKNSKPLEEEEKQPPSIAFNEQLQFSHKIEMNPRHEHGGWLQKAFKYTHTYIHTKAINRTTNIASDVIGKDGDYYDNGDDDDDVIVVIQ